MAEYKVTTATELAIAACDLFGMAPISSINADNKVANACRRNLPIVKRTMLRCFPWSCLMRRQRIAAETAAPEFGFAYQYILNPMCQQVWYVNGYKLPYRTFSYENRRILSNADNSSPIEVVYVTDTEDYTEISDDLLTALAYALAIRVAPACGANVGYIDKLKPLADEALADAMNNDKMGNQVVRARGGDQNELYRYGGVDTYDFAPTKFEDGESSYPME